MANKKGDFPQPKKLLFPRGGFLKENWSFIQDDIARKIIEPGESKEALFYERARTLLEKGNLKEKVQEFLQTASKGHFPNSPFLKLPNPIRQSLIDAVRDPNNSLYIGPKFTYRPLAVKGVIGYALEPQLEFRMEQLAYQTALETSEKFPGSKPEDFLSPLTAPERAVRKEMNRLMASENPGIDRSRCSLTLEVDFTRSPTEIVREFENIITRERDKWKQQVSESRGKSTSPSLPFRELAILRLFDYCGSVNGVCTFLEKEGIDTLQIYKSPKGWNDARKRALKGLDQLKIDLGQTDAPTASSTETD